jgi:hypothetical protein
VQSSGTPGTHALNKAVFFASRRAKKRLGILMRTFSICEGAFPHFEEEPPMFVLGIRTGSSKQDLNWLV